MSILVTCGRCGKRWRFKDESAGKRFRCAGCGEVSTVTDRSAPPARGAAPPPAVREIGIVFDVDGLGEGFYRQNAYLVLFRTLDPGRLPGCTLCDGHGAETPAGRTPPYCIALRAADPSQVGYVREMLTACAAPGLLPPGERFLEGDVTGSQGLEPAARIDPAGRLVVQAQSLPPEWVQGTAWAVAEPGDQPAPPAVDPPAARSGAGEGSPPTAGAGPPGEAAVPSGDAPQPAAPVRRRFPIWAKVVLLAWVVTVVAVTAVAWVDAESAAAENTLRVVPPGMVAMTVFDVQSLGDDPRMLQQVPYYANDILQFTYWGVSRKREYPNMREFEMGGQKLYCRGVMNGQYEHPQKLTIYGRHGTVTIPFEASEFDHPVDLRTPAEKEADFWILMDKTYLIVLATLLGAGLVGFAVLVLTSVVRGAGRRAAG